VLHAPARDLLDRFAPGAGDEVRAGLFLGQNLYTPRAIGIAAAQPFDRPWAAWLYLGAVAQRAREGRLDTVEIDVGMVGPAALGRQVQTAWHRLIGAPKPLGWANQLPDEPAFLASYLQKRRYGGGRLDLVAHAGITAGTVMTLGRLGGMVRFGQNLSGFGPDTVEPGGAMLQGHERGPGRAGSGEWYVFAGVDQRLVARNIFLDGTFFRDSPSVERRRHVYDLSAGFSLRLENVRLSFTRLRRSEEFRTPLGGGGVQRFDSLNIGIDF
ncbi:MAG: lipid A deacylase LpxR family protein, partial [Rhodocyclaceae bacterium]|nr:lipid A deacylase LpxR family protein [Rhodocyclaceae bacterium]